MGLLTCIDCRRILDEGEFYFWKKEGRRDRRCRDCDNRRRRESRRTRPRAGGNWLVTGCVHIPCEHPDLFDWYDALNRKYRFGLHVNLGDLYNWECMSSHMRDPNLQSANQEYALSIPKRERFYALFPQTHLLWGNHDARIMNKCAEACIPSFLVHGLRKTYGLPAGWESTEDRYITLEHPRWGEISFFHGDGISPEALSNAKQIGRHVVMADRHTKCGVNHASTIIGSHLFGVNTGCGVDPARAEYNYSKKSLKRPVVAVCAFIDGNPMNILMERDKTGRWVGKL